MSHRQRNQLTILRAMSGIAILGVVLGVFAANRHDQDVVAAVLWASLVIIIPVHLAIEGNRRDVMNAGGERTGRSDPKDGGPPHGVAR